MSPKYQICKKQKLQKILKRGPGVAELEKNRVQQLEKKGEVMAFQAISPSSSTKSPYLVRSFPDFHHHHCDKPSFAPRSPLESNTVLVPSSGHGIMVPAGLFFVPSLPRQSNSNFIRAVPKWVLRTQSRQQHHRSSSVMNSSYSTELPSSQNNGGGYWMPNLQMQYEKMIAMKRPYPFAEASSGFNYVAKGTLRKVPYSPTFNNSDANTKRSNRVRVDENFSGYFLTSTSLLCSPSKSKSPSTFPAFHNHRDSLSYFQGTREDQMSHSPEYGYSGFNKVQQPCHIMDPAGAGVKKAAQIRKTSARIQNDREVPEIESVDLNLKL